jgi:predicted CoA-binding protein
MTSIPRPSRDDLVRIYADTKVIAVVGASDDRSKPAGNIPAYLQSQGYRIIPVNPTRDTVLGERSYASLADVDEPVDVVDVFRPAPEGSDIARQAAQIGAKVIWFQPGTQSGDASRVAHDAGLTVISRICMGATHGTLGLGPGPDEH